jgi:adenylosuccinate synthase
MMKGKVTVVIDGMAGSCGKGKIVGYVALQNNVTAAVSNAMPNSGHYFEKDGKRRFFRTIPISAVNPNTRLFIGSGTAINMDVLEEEYEKNKDILEGREIIVHPRVPIIEERHKQLERDMVRTGSTYQGGGACLAEKVMRNPQLKFFKGYKNIKVSNNYIDEINKILDDGGEVLLEGSQGADLCSENGLGSHVTSRPVNVSQLLSYSGISPFFLKNVIMVIRPYPIRISNSNELGIEISSGSYADSSEITWEDVNYRSGAATGHYVYLDKNEKYEDYDNPYGSKYDYTELTSVSKQKRRLFELSVARLEHNVKINQPTEIVLNFFQQLDDNYREVSGLWEKIYMEKYLRVYIDWLEDALDRDITLLGTGPDNNHIIDRTGYVKKIKRNRL